MALGPNGRLWVGGNFGQRVTLGGQPFQAHGVNDFFLFSFVE